MHTQFKDQRALLQHHSDRQNLSLSFALPPPPAASRPFPPPPPSTVRPLLLRPFPAGLNEMIVLGGRSIQIMHKKRTDERMPYR